MTCVGAKLVLCKATGIRYVEGADLPPGYRVCSRSAGFIPSTAAACRGVASSFCGEVELIDHLSNDKQYRIEIVDTYLVVIFVGRDVVFF